MSRIEIREERCKGCRLCQAACPVDIIIPSDRFNADGYKVVHVPENEAEKCIGCASCAVVCPDVAIRVFKTTKAAREEV